MFLNIPFSDGEVSLAFLQAAQALSCAQPHFRPQGTPQMVALASAISIQDTDHLYLTTERQAALNRWGTYRGQRIHAKYLHNTAHPAFSPDHLYEGLIACLTFDMGFPVTAQALAVEPVSKNLYRVGLDPFSKSQTIEDFLPAYQGQATETADYYPERLGHFFTAHPQLLPAFISLTAQDLWSTNGDRHTKNILIDVSHNSSPTALCGIDQTDRGAPLATNQAAKRVVQGPFIDQLPTDLLHADLFRPALAVLESYPVERISQIAGLFGAMATQKNGFDPDETTHQLRKNQKSLRGSLRKMLPKSIAASLR